MHFKFKMRVNIFINKLNAAAIYLNNNLAKSLFLENKSLDSYKQKIPDILLYENNSAKMRC